MFKNHLVDDAELTIRLFREKYKISYAPLSLVYGEEPPAIDIMIRQRARWARGFLSLLGHRMAYPLDIIGSIYWLLPIATYSGLGIFFIIAYASLHLLLLGSVPYGFYYLPIKIWFFFMALNFVLSILVLIKQHGLPGIKYALYFPIYLVFSQYIFVGYTYKGDLHKIMGHDENDAMGLGKRLKKCHSWFFFFRTFRCHIRENPIVFIRNFFLYTLHILLNLLLM